MKTSKKIQLFLVDDDVLFLKSLEIDFFQHTDFEIETYSTGELCMENIFHKPDLIVLDYELDGIDKYAMNGLETLDRIKSFNPDIPVLMLSSQDKIEIAISCMHHKAYDYLVKSKTVFVNLNNKINSHFSFKQIDELNWF